MLTPLGHADHSHLAIDGKALRATSKQEHPVHQLSCYEVTTGRVVWHCNVQEKHNEISELKPFLTTELVKGRILSLDALHTQRELCRQVHRLEGDYLLIAKDNQPTLKEDIADYFEDPRLTVVDGRRPRRGTRDTGDWSIAKSCIVLT